MSLSCQWNFSDKINLSLFWRWSFIIKKASYWNLVTKNLVIYFLKFNIELSLKFRCQIILSPFRHRNFSVNFLTFHFKNGIKISFIFWSHTQFNGAWPCLSLTTRGHGTLATHARSPHQAASPPSLPLSRPCTSLAATVASPPHSAATVAGAVSPPRDLAKYSFFVSSL